MAKGSLLPLMLLAISALSNTAVAASPLLDYLDIDENNPLLSRNLSSSGIRRHRLFKEGKLKRGTRTKEKFIAANAIANTRIDGIGDNSDNSDSSSSTNISSDSSSSSSSEDDGHQHGSRDNGNMNVGYHTHNDMKVQKRVDSSSSDSSDSSSTSSSDDSSSTTSSGSGDVTMGVDVEVNVEGSDSHVQTEEHDEYDGNGNRSHSTQVNSHSHDGSSTSTTSDSTTSSSTDDSSSSSEEDDPDCEEVDNLIMAPRLNNNNNRNLKSNKAGKLHKSAKYTKYDKLHDSQGPAHTGHNPGHNNENDGLWQSLGYHNTHDGTDNQEDEDGGWWINNGLWGYHPSPKTTKSSKLTKSKSGKSKSGKSKGGKSNPTTNPTSSPKVKCTPRPTGSPTSSPSDAPSTSPTKEPISLSPTRSPVTPSPTTDSPTTRPVSGMPTERPTIIVTPAPNTDAPTKSPIAVGSPTKSPTAPEPTTENPTATPTESQTESPIGSTSAPNTVNPTTSPVRETPTYNPTGPPSKIPTETPTASPTTAVPTRSPSTSSMPSGAPSTSSVPSISSMPSDVSSSAPSDIPSSVPPDMPSNMPSSAPSDIPSSAPSDMPSNTPSSAPSNMPSSAPTEGGTGEIIDTDPPSFQPSTSNAPSDAPSISYMPSMSTVPSDAPSTSSMPSISSAIPSSHPSVMPSLSPSDGGGGTAQPTGGSTSPSAAPSTAPSVSVLPVMPAPTTISPTSTPDDAVYYDGFEQVSFPELDEEWNTSGDLPWELTTQEANSGVYSIRSPNLTNGEFTPGESNVTLSANPAWGAGTLHFAVYPSVQPPQDDVRIFVNGVQRGGGSNIINPNGFEEQELQLSSGTQTITFAYRWNPFDLDALQQGPPDRIGVVFLDDVYFVPSDDNAPVPSIAPSQGGGTPTCVSLSPNPDDFEDGTFPSLPWSTGGDGDWTITNDRSFENSGTSIRSPVLDGSTVAAVSNATLEICDDFAGGLLRLQALASVLPPSDIFYVYVDGDQAAQLIDVNDWTEIALGLEPGPHRIDFSYQYNTFGLDPLTPPTPPTREGAVWIDLVAIDSSGTSAKRREGKDKKKI